ncbi:hypothetical protein [Nitrosopumilus sp.]|uniref:hypothetical protein n=1 Tax=Nitrosopumilus sp. TaxID=2024843 RepID=UPI00247D476B|nr:hypothetical protein [Nitrosopumilus sp.]MCV0430339.1 hypothetical protein [Nitrosopumilus sp.]
MNTKIFRDSKVLWSFFSVSAAIFIYILITAPDPLAGHVGTQLTFPLVMMVATLMVIFFGTPESKKQRENKE